MDKRERLKEIAVELKRKPSRENWELFADAAGKAGASYYKIVYPPELGGKADLTKAHAEIFGKDRKRICDVPIILEEGKKVRGSTIYLKGLELKRER